MFKSNSEMNIVMINYGFFLVYYINIFKINCGWIHNIKVNIEGRKSSELSYH